MKCGESNCPTAEVIFFPLHPWVQAFVEALEPSNQQEQGTWFANRAGLRGLKLTVSYVSDGAKNFCWRGRPGLQPLPSRLLKSNVNNFNSV